MGVFVPDTADPIVVVKREHILAEGCGPVGYGEPCFVAFHLSAHKNEEQGEHDEQLRIAAEPWA